MFNKKAFLMIGLPGSGKSYQTNLLFDQNPNSAIFCLDNIREMLCGQYPKFPFDKKAYSKVLGNLKEQTIQSAIKNELNLIIDETHITKKSRNRTINLIKQYDLDNQYEIIYIWCINENSNLEWRMKSPKGNSEKLWNSVINNMQSHFENPNINENQWISNIEKKIIHKESI